MDSPVPSSPADFIFVENVLTVKERIFIELMTSDRKLQASREGSK